VIDSGDVIHKTWTIQKTRDIQKVGVNCEMGDSRKPLDCANELGKEWAKPAVGEFVSVVGRQRESESAEDCQRALRREFSRQWERECGNESEKAFGKALGRESGWILSTESKLAR
jgi:hypothetical protein